MCRHLAYLGPPTTLESFLVTADHALARQARRPRHQEHGRDNPDGYGVGWFDRDGCPHRHRTTRPIWDDPDLPALAASITTSAAVAAARLASPGSPVEETGNAPFTDGTWLFSLNGVVHGFHEGVGDDLRAGLSRRRRNAITGAADSEVLFAAALDRLDAGAGPGEAVAGVVADVEARTTGALNLLLTDGRRLAATAAGRSLFRCVGDGSVLVVSEPLDASPEWERVPDRTLLEGDARDLEVHPL